MKRNRFGSPSRRRCFCSGSRPHEVMDSAARHLDGTFFREYLGDVPIRPTLLRSSSMNSRYGSRRERGGLTGSSARTFFRSVSILVSLGGPFAL
jgi:hypothetical protein